MPARRKFDPYWHAPLFARERRLSIQRGILGPDAACDRCGEVRLPALQRRASEVICYECQAEEEGRTRIELDHPLGRGDRWIHYTVPTPGNEHRLLSDPDAGPEARLRARLEVTDPRLRRLLRRL
jgi:hypothetical protein